MTRFLVRFALLVLVAFALTGCGGNWLVGKWVLDEERTLDELTRVEESDPPEDAGKGFLRDIVGGLQKGLSRVLLTQFEGVTLEFTPTEVRRVRQGMGEAMSYEIIERPDPGTYLVKYEDGDIVTWAKAEGGIRLKLTGEGDTWVYFRPVAEP